MKNKTYDKIIGSLMAFSMFGILMFLLYGAFFIEDKDEELTLNVIGIENATNSSLIAFHLECIEFCSNKFYGDSFKLKICYSQCELLGNGRDKE